jgi:hypothetical protein
MAIGENGKAVKTTANVRPQEFASRLGAHVHKGSGESTVGGPGCTTSPDSSLAGADSSSPYGSGGDA